MEENSILEFNNKESVPDVLSELLREGAQQLIHQAVEAELSEYISCSGSVEILKNRVLFIIGKSTIIEV
jgi:hypothetical protein